MKHPARRKLPGKETVAAENGVWELRLYLAGQTPKSVTARANLERICSEHLVGRYRVEVIDLAKTPQLAAVDQIIAVPTLLRKLPPPVRKIIGDLSNTERVLIGLGVRHPPLDLQIPDQT